MMHQKMASSFSINLAISSFNMTISLFKFSALSNSFCLLKNLNIQIKINTITQFLSSFIIMLLAMLSIFFFMNISPPESFFACNVLLILLNLHFNFFLRNPTSSSLTYSLTIVKLISYSAFYFSWFII